MDALRTAATQGRQGHVVRALAASSGKEDAVGARQVAVARPGLAAVGAALTLGYTACTSQPDPKLQKEVADRIAAAPGGRDYGVLSVVLVVQTVLAALTELARALEQMEGEHERVLIAEPRNLLALRAAFPGYHALRDFLREHRIPHAIAFDSWAETPAA